MLKKAFSAVAKVKDVVGTWATGKGWLIFPFFAVTASACLAPAIMAAAAATAAGAGAASVGTIAAGVTKGAVATSFWSPIATNAATGATGVMPALTNLFNGGVALAGNTASIAGSSISGAVSGATNGVGILGGLKTAFLNSIHSPAYLGPLAGSPAMAAV